MAKQATARRWSSRNDLGDNAKETSINTLQAILIDTLDLYNVTRQAHWNLKGSNFIGVHEMLEKFYNQLNEFTDLVAERIVLIGGIADGTTQTLAGTTRLPPYRNDLLDSMAHLDALGERYALVAKATRAGIDETDEAGDADTADLLTEISRALDKNLWMIDAHLHGHGAAKDR